MTKKTKKLTGKEQAKSNKRKKFYEKLERFYDRFQESDDQVIFLSMNKKHSFPEFDGLSKILNKNFVEFDKGIKIKDSKSIEIVYFEEAHFLLENSKSNFIKICRRETKFNNEGKLRKGVSSSNEDYDYQTAYNWAIKMDRNEKFAEILANEKLDPSKYDLTPPKAVILESIHYKSKRPPRRKRR